MFRMCMILLDLIYPILFFQKNKNLKKMDAEPDVSDFAPFFFYSLIQKRNLFTLGFLFF